VKELKPKTLKGRVIVPGRRVGETLVSKQPISFLGGVNPETGKVIEKGHELEGKCLKDKVLCFPHGHGSTVGSYVLYSLARRKLAPKAILNEAADPVVVVGAIIAEIPMLDQVDIRKLKTGDLVEVDGENGLVKILKRKNPCT